MPSRDFNARKSKVYPRQRSFESPRYVVDFSSLEFGGNMFNGPRLAPALDNAHG